MSAATSRCRRWGDLQRGRAEICAECLGFSGTLSRERIEEWHFGHQPASRWLRPPRTIRRLGGRLQVDRTPDELLAAEAPREPLHRPRRLILVVTERQSNGGERPAWPGPAGQPIPVVAAVVLLLALVATGCGDRRDQTVAADEREDPPASVPAWDDVASGTVRVRLEPVEGLFIEGFEIGLRFETGEGTLIAATLWSDFVRSTGETDIDAFYDSVLSQPVPAGTVRVQAEVNIGIGPAPDVPDLAGELPCELVLEVGSGVETTVEVTFDGSDECLGIVAGSGGAHSGSETTGSAPTTSTVPPGPPPLDVGTTHYVDVDLECQAFELGGIWVLADGDTSTWQPPGERHEGGMFTIESPGRGRFVGDARGQKTATFERVDDAIDPPCAPQPRPS